MAFPAHLRSKSLRQLITSSEHLLEQPDTGGSIPFPATISSLDSDSVLTVYVF